MAELLCDRDEVVDSAGLKERFLGVQTELDQGDSVAVKDHIEVAAKILFTTVDAKQFETNLTRLNC